MDGCTSPSVSSVARSANGPELPLAAVDVQELVGGGLAVAQTAVCFGSIFPSGGFQRMVPSSHEYAVCGSDGG